MREKKEKFIVDSFEADIEADYSVWKDKEKQDEYLKKVACQIGWIIIEFNKLEWQLNEVLKQYFCNDLEELSAIYYDLIASYNFAKKVDLLKSFYKVYGNGTKKNIFDTSNELKEWDMQVDNLIKKLTTASQIRNKYAHCFWHRLDEQKFVEFKSVVNPKEGLNKVLVRFDEQDLITDFELIEDLQIDLFNTDSAFNEAFTNT